VTWFEKAVIAYALILAALIIFAVVNR